MPEIIDWQEITTDSLVFLDPKSNSHHGMSIPVRHKDPKTGQLRPVLFQTPVLRMPFGHSDKTGDYGRKIEAAFGFPHYQASSNKDGEFEVGFDSSNDKGDITAKFYEWIATWDKLNKEKACENGRQWFKKDISPIVIDELYKPNLRPSSNIEKYSPTFRTKIPTKKEDSTLPDGTICTKELPISLVFNAKQKEIDLTELTPGTQAICLLKTSGLWFAGKSFGMNFSIVQIVKLHSDKFEGCAITIPPHLGGMQSDAECFERDNKRMRISPPAVACE